MKTSKAPQRVAIYSPYLDTLGGGEKYISTITEILSKQHSVDLLFDKHLQSFGMNTLKMQLMARFNLDLSRVNLVEAPIGKESNFVSRFFFLKKYDLLFYLTDGSIFIPSAKKNILHIQSPIRGEPSESLWGKTKLKGWDLIIYNSLFTQIHSTNNWPLTSKVIYPPVDVEKIRPLKKKKYILSVGRFFGYLKDKKHRLLIEIFKKLYKKRELEGWSLHLVGSASEGDKSYIEELKKLAKELPINFYPNLRYDDLIKLYGQSSIYWHAAGFGEDDPTKMEHFGISTVEAMAAGCVPVVIKKGGQVEIINESCGFLWETLDDFGKFSLKIILDENLRLKMSKEAIKRAEIFSKDVFIKKILKLTVFK